MKQLLFSFLLLFLIACTPAAQTPPDTMMDDERVTDEMMEEMQEEMMEHIEEQNIPADGWRNTQLTDVLTGNQFTINDFAGRPILLESFAVWCPKCLQQQKEMKKITDDNVVLISLDTDPNEDAQQVIDHANRNNLDWSFVVSPVDVTKSLIDEFGVGVVNAPQEPIVLVCPDQSVRLLPRGHKSTDKLINEITSC